MTGRRADAHGDHGDGDADVGTRSREDRRTLLYVLLLNVLLSVALAVTGLSADSSGLLANALDNASDSVVYAISFFAVGRPARWKRTAAAISGVMLLVLAVSVLGDAARRFVAGSEPIGPTMIAMSVVAAAVNAWCLRLLRRLRGRDVNLRAAVVFSANDFVSNVGLLLAGVLVAWTGRFWPDLAVGAAIAAVAAKGGVEILRDVRAGDAAARGGAR